ncbi:MAG: NifB/NifX family molybdenum-iron cluster-binding protein [Conexivisphaerales archaeon]
MKVIMPVMENHGIESRVTGHPRMAPYFAVAKINGDDPGTVDIIENPYKEENHHAFHHHEGNHEGANQFFKFLTDLEPDVLISYNIGPGAFYRFREIGVKMYLPKGHTVKENIDALKADTLTEISEPLD